MPDFPAWLQKILSLDAEKLKALGVEAADIEAAKTGYSATAALTATVEKVREKYPDLNIEQAVDVAQQYQQWRSTSWPEFERRYNAMLTENEELKRRPAAAAPAAAAESGRQYPITQDDLWETAKLQSALGKIDDQINERAFTRTKDWWEKDVAPGWQKTADNYMDVSLRLQNFLYDLMRNGKGPDWNALLREAGTSGERDFGKVYAALAKTGETTTKAGEEAGYLKAKTEYDAKLKELQSPVVAASPTGPSGSSMPSWKSAAPEKAPANGLDLKARVLGDVAKKHGPLPA